MGSSCSIDSVIYSQIFMPPDSAMDTLADLKKRGASTFTTESSKYNLSITACVAKPKILSDKYIIYSHGNGEDIFGAFEFMKVLADRLGVNCIVYDYPGYGKSTGEMTEQNCYDSLEMVVEYVVKSGVLPKNISLIGRSLGTGIVVEYVHTHNWTYPIILISPYKSIVTVVTESSLGQFIDKFKTIDKINKVQCPVKIFHGEDDNVISIEHGKEVYKNLPKGCKMVPCWIKHAGHNNIMSKLNDLDLMQVVFYDKKI